MNTFLEGVFIYLDIGLVFTLAWLVIGLINDSREENKDILQLMSEMRPGKTFVFVVVTTALWPIPAGMITREWLERRQ